MGPMNHVLDGVQIPTREWAILRAKRGRPGHDQTCPAVDMLKATQQGAAPVHRVPIGCTRSGLHLCCLACVVAMRPYVKLIDHLFNLYSTEDYYTYTHYLNGYFAGERTSSCFERYLLSVTGAGFFLQDECPLRQPTDNVKVEKLTQHKGIIASSVTDYSSASCRCVYPGSPMPV